MMNHLNRFVALVTLCLCFVVSAFAQNCSDPAACNYDPASTGGVFDAPCLFVETVAVHTDGNLAGMSTYRVYFQAEGPADFVTSVYGNQALPLSVTTTTSFYQDALGGPSSQPQNPLLFPSFPDLIYDSYVTIGLTESANGAAGETAPSLIASPNQDWITAFDPGGGAPGGDIIINDEVGGIWYIFNGDANGFPNADNRVLLAQLTTDGDLGGTLNVQYFPAGGDAVEVTLSIENACQSAPEDCTYPDACGICDGPGEIYDCGCFDIPAGDCDCNGNQADALGVCGGSCTADVDGDGVCDDVDDCVGDLDACGVCNGPGAIYDCGCNDSRAGECDCNGGQLDAVDVCGGDCTSDVDGDGICDTDETAGCTDNTACNFNPSATDDDGSCAQLDVCGVCGGPGDIYDCGCADIPAGDCDCNGGQLDALDVCGGSCTADRSPITACTPMW
jgi:hypothetical protein